MNLEARCEKWIWTELLAFDADLPDQGVQAYFEATGFVPDVISLLIGAPDFVLQHRGLDESQTLPADFCSRDGHDGNESRRRQEWTSHQLRDLIARLHQAGSKVYLSNFTHYLEDKFHHEWLSDHPEGKVVFAGRGRLPGLNILARFEDGTYLQEHFAAQLTQVCLDYGFDGWHGPDGFGPLGPPIYIGDCSDDMIAQFVESGQTGLPESVVAASEDLPERLQERIDWIWRHRRLEWIHFWTERWADFWCVISSAMHAIGRKAVVNSAWTRDPFEAMYRYGIDYRKLVAAGVDGIVVETVASSIMLALGDRDYHYDYLAMLLLIKAYVPDAKLIFLHPIKDVAESWDLLRHAPAMLEREIYSLANVYHTSTHGKQLRCADGFLACLGDGISHEEWQWLRQRWELAFDELPIGVPGATVVWSDEALHNHLADFPVQRDCSMHRVVHRLMQSNAPIQTSVNIHDIHHATTPLLVINPHLFPDEQRKALLGCGKTLIAIGPDFSNWPQAEEIVDVSEARPLRCRLYHADAFGLGDFQPDGTEKLATLPPEEFPGIKDPRGFREELYFQPVSEGFVQACARLIRTVSGAFSMQEDNPKVTVMMTRQSPDTYRLAVKSSDSIYCQAKIDIAETIESVTARTSFPVTTIIPDGSRLAIKIPLRGIVVIDVKTA